MGYVIFEKKKKRQYMLALQRNRDYLYQNNLSESFAKISLSGIFGKFYGKTVNFTRLVDIEDATFQRHNQERIFLDIFKRLEKC